MTTRALFLVFACGLSGAASAADRYVATAELVIIGCPAGAYGVVLVSGGIAPPPNRMRTVGMGSMVDAVCSESAMDEASKGPLKDFAGKPYHFFGPNSDSVRAQFDGWLGSGFPVRLEDINREEIFALEQRAVALQRQIDLLSEQLTSLPQTLVNDPHFRRALGEQSNR